VEKNKVNEKKVLITYIRDKNRRPTGIVVAIDPEHLGWSLWNRKKKKYVSNDEKKSVIIIRDKWNREEGFNRALGRAKLGLNWVKELKKEYRISKNIDFLEDITMNRNIEKKHPRIFFDLIPHLFKMRERAEKYYNKK